MDISQHVRAIFSFVEASEHGSFSAAARKLGISPAAVSKNVAGLEKVLGVRLMNRTTRKVSLTEEGQAFLQQARIALEALESAVDNIVSKKMDTLGHVRVSTSAAFGRDYLLPALPGLLGLYPGLSVEADFDDRVTDLIKDGYDIAIRGGRIQDSTLITRPICNLKTVLVASPEYLASHGIPVTPDSLYSHKLITRRFLGGAVTPWNFKQDNGSIYSLNLEGAYLTLSAPEASLQAALSGLGIALVGIHHAYRYLQSGELHVILYGLHDPGNYELVIQYPHRSLIAPRVKVTVEYLLSEFKSDPSLHIPIADLAQFAV